MSFLLFIANTFQRFIFLKKSRILILEKCKHSSINGSLGSKAFLKEICFVRNDSEPSLHSHGTNTVRRGRNLSVSRQRWLYQFLTVELPVGTAFEVRFGKEMVLHMEAPASYNNSRDNYGDGAQVHRRWPRKGGVGDFGQAAIQAQLQAYMCE